MALCSRPKDREPTVFLGTCSSAALLSEEMSVNVLYEGPKLEVGATAPCFAALQILANCVLSCATDSYKLILDATIASYLPDGSLYFTATNWCTFY